jgi:hypothetical protein
MLYTKKTCPNTIDYKIKEYKNGYMLNLIGSNLAIRIFIVKNFGVKLVHSNIKLYEYYANMIHNLYLYIRKHKNIFIKMNKFVKSSESMVSQAILNSVWKFKNFLWFKGRSFVAKKDLLFINNGRIQQLKFQPPIILNWILSRKRKFMGIKSNSLNFLQLYIYLMYTSYFPNTFTGKGIRIRGLMLRKKLGKRKIY